MVRVVYGISNTAIDLQNDSWLPVFSVEVENQTRTIKYKNSQYSPYKITKHTILNLFITDLMWSTDVGKYLVTKEMEIKSNSTTVTDSTYKPQPTVNGTLLDKKNKEYAQIICKDIQNNCYLL